MTPAAIIFDFDGVIADSEVASNQAFADFLTKEGLPTSYDDALDTYCGHRWAENRATIEAKMGRAMSDEFAQRMRDHVDAVTRAALKPVRGIHDLIERAAHLPKAVASSSPPEWLNTGLAAFGLDHHFTTHVYSAAHGMPGKPHPAVYLAAAQGLGVDPQRCWALEDSPVGAQAALCAGMHVIGCCTAGHIRPGHRDLLLAKGVHRVIDSYQEVVLP